jgi:hypothetical protein
MWSEVVFEGATAVRAMEMAHALRSDGLVLNKDFIWAWMPKDSIVVGGTENCIMDQKRVTIGFRDPAMATFYSLKWQR